jgi:hypothetical protein
MLGTLFSSSDSAMRRRSPSALQAVSMSESAALPNQGLDFRALFVV